jgi:hypothetical protein
MYLLQLVPAFDELDAVSKQLWADIDSEPVEHSSVRRPLGRSVGIILLGHVDVRLQFQRLIYQIETPCI